MSVVSNTMQFLLILVGRQCRGVDRTFQRGGGGEKGVTFSQTQRTYWLVASTSTLLLLKVTIFRMSSECGGRDKHTK